MVKKKVLTPRRRVAKLSARELGYLTITGSTFRAAPFNAPFYADLDAAEDLTPHPVMVERRRVEQELGLDSFGPRLVMRLTIGS